jgi:hypothetical protein
MKVVSGNGQARSEERQRRSHCQVKLTAQARMNLRTRRVRAVALRRFTPRSPSVNLNAIDRSRVYREVRNQWFV